MLILFIYIYIYIFLKKKSLIDAVRQVSFVLHEVLRIGICGLRKMFSSGAVLHWDSMSLAQ